MGSSAGYWPSADAVCSNAVLHVRMNDRRAFESRLRAPESVLECLASAVPFEFYRILVKRLPSTSPVPITFVILRQTRHVTTWYASPRTYDGIQFDHIGYLPIAQLLRIERSDAGTVAACDINKCRILLLAGRQPAWSTKDR